MHVSSITRISPPHAGPSPLTPRRPFSLSLGPDVVDVSVTLDLSCEDKVFQGKAVVGARHVLDWYFHGTEFVEFIVFDVLRLCRRGFIVFTWRGD